MVDLDIRLKGNRNYLHSTDVYAAVQRYADQTLGTGAWVKQLAFRKLATHQCELRTQRPDIGTNTCATASLVASDGKQTNVWLVETEKEALGRYDFDESSITERVRLKGGAVSATVDHQPACPAIDELVTAVKVLNYSVYPDIQGNWLFGKLLLKERLPDHPRYMSISMIKAIDGRFSICEVSVDGRYIGDIQFIVGVVA